MATYHRSQRLKLIGSPSVEQLQNGRYRLTFNMKSSNPDEDWYFVNKSRIFADYGTLQSATMSIAGIGPRTGEAYDNMRLVSASSSQSSEGYVITFVYETLSGSFVREVDDVFSEDENGLRVLKRVSIAQAGADYTGSVGTTFIDSQIDSETAVRVYLAGFDMENTDSFRRVTERYVEAGTISIDKSTGPQGLPSTYTRTYTSRFTEPTSSGIALNRGVSNVNGYPQYVYTFLEGSAEGSSPLGASGVIISYQEIIEVRQAGVVSGSSVNVTDGSVAVLDTVPPSIKKIKADVTISLVTTNTLSDPTNFAYNLSNTSVSASITTTRKTPVGVEQGSSLTVSVFNTNSSSDTRTFPNHYRTNGGSSGTVTSPAQLIRDEDNIIGEALNSSTDTSIFITGSTSAPATTGTYQESLDPAFLDADGTQYYRKTVYSIPA